MTAAPLAGLTVVEIGTSVAAPVGGHILGDLGATVFKIERPTTGDDARSWGPPFKEGMSPVFRTLNRNKHSIAVDLADERARGALKAFIADQADIVIQNLRAGLVVRYGIDAASLRELRPDLIYCNLSAFGTAGPRQADPGYDPLMQACAGIMSVTGHEGADPVRVGPSLVDQGAGMWAVIGILAALRAREATGQGCEIDTSLYETAIAWVPAQIASLGLTGAVPRPLGTENAGIAPYRAYKARDGWIVIAAGNDRLFLQLCSALDRSVWAADNRFATNRERVLHRSTLNRLVAEAVVDSSIAELAQRLAAAGVPNAPVLKLDQVISDPQFMAVGMLQQIGDGEEAQVGLPLSFDGVRPALRTPPPLLGDANAELHRYFA